MTIDIEVKNPKWTDVATELELTIDVWNRGLLADVKKRFQKPFSGILEELPENRLKVWIKRSFSADQLKEPISDHYMNVNIQPVVE